MKDPYQAGFEHSQALGTRSPRLLGTVLIGAGIGVGALNLLLIKLLGIYFGGLFVIGMPALFIGIWTLFTGRTHSALSQKPPQWWTLGFYASLALGLLAGLWLAIWIPKLSPTDPTSAAAPQAEMASNASPQSP
jgi:membrane-bound ClpP family serine protease